MLKGSAARILAFRGVMLRSLSACLACLVLLLGSTAYAARGPVRATNGIPSFDIQAACRALAQVPEARLLDIKQPNANRDCLRDERRARSTLSKEWSQFTRADKRVCVGVSRQGDVDSVYTELLSCLEMARDARQPVSTNRPA